MYKKLLLGFVLSAFLVGTVSAQSSPKGSSAKSTSGSSSKSTSGSSSKSSSYRSNASAEMKQKERFEAKEKTKLFSQIQKEDFAGVKLDIEQKKMLKGLVSDNYAGLAKIDLQIVNMIPVDKKKKLKKFYLKSKKDGMSHEASMKASMMKIGMDESLSMKVMKLNESKDVLLDEIRSGVTKMLTEDQKKIKMEMMAKEEMKMKEKEAMMAKEKEEMMAKEKEEMTKEKEDQATLSSN